MVQYNRVFVLETPEDAAAFAMGRWIEISGQSIEKRGRFTAALSGGKTPADFYRKLGGRQNLSWDRTHLFIVDERYVPVEHEDSNFRMIKESLLRSVNLPERNIHAIPTEEGTPEISAKKYEKNIKDFFELPKGAWPSFDLIMLGIGEDGHTASLFPAAPALSEARRLAVAVGGGKVKHHRISITLPVINSAKNVIFLVTGENKAHVVKEIIEDNNTQLPASLVNPKNGEVLFLLDKSAGMLLS